ncbi:MAG TPA: sulfatase-like hydrolase/transferase [Oceanipulchritudo sp.]|nr:sulfatase-like hydrolase/transferase [Oceanipulchritudo sp.]
MRPKKPNILVLMTDQHRFDALSCRGHPHVHTPHLDALLARSVDFQSAYTQAPVCAPARYSLATGRYVDSHGVRFNEVNPAAPVRTVAHAFREAGYRCFQMGHMHWSRETVDTGYEPLLSREAWLKTLSPSDARRARAEHDTDFVRTQMGGPSPLPESAFWGHFVAAEAIRKMDEAVAGREPFFCWASLFEPHPPFFPPAELYEKFDPALIEIPREPEGAAAHLEPLLRQRRKKWAHLTETEIRQMKAGYYGMVELADRCAGRILDHLTAIGELDNTWIVWTSDHGEQLFDHRLFLKFCMFEESVHVPFSLCGPGLEPHVRKELVEHVDLYPTLCALAGLPEPDGLDGVSLEPLLTPAKAPEDWRTSVFSQINQVHMVRTKQWKLVVRDGRPVMLFDLQVDPGEFENRVEDSECAGMRELLLRELQSRFEL